MVIHWAWLVVALGFLWSPPLLSRETRKRLGRRPWQRSGSLLDLILFGSNWWDLLRGGLGGFILAVFAVTPDPKARNAASMILMFWTACSGVGIVLQSVRFQREPVFIGPIFYVMGLTLLAWGVPGLETAGFALFVAWLFALAGQSPGFLLPIYAVAYGIGGYVLSGDLVRTGLTVVLILIAPVLGQLFRKPLVYLTRAT
jgi:hypothetical protein